MEDREVPMVPIYIVAFNRVTYLKQLLEYVEQLSNTVPIIVDNCSTYPPMVDFLEQTDHQVVRLQENIGIRALLQSEIIKRGQEHERYYGDQFYVFTDEDLDLSNCPFDVIDVLREGLRRYSWAQKAGVGLELSDIPDGVLHREEVLKWEASFWWDRLDRRFFNSPVASTFFVTHCETPFCQDKWIFDSLRSDIPYVARHLPWYETWDTLTEENLFYYANLGGVFTHWSSRTKDLLLQLGRI
jgi:hypothetical protein